MGVAKFQPTPFVTIAGYRVATRPPADLNTLDVERIALDGVSITWGRRSPLAQPDPATGTLRLFDASNTWGTSRDLRGAAVTLGWEGTDPATGSPVSRTYFRGRVSAPIQLGRKVVQLPNGSRVAGALLTLPLVSALVDLANVVPTAAWPAETGEARRARVAAATASVLPGGVQTRPYWHPPEHAPVHAADQVSLYEHLVRLYDSAGADRLVYLPHDQRVEWIDQRDWADSRGNATLWWNPASNVHGQSGKGAYVRATYGPAGTAVQGYLDAALVEYPEDAGISQPEKITVVQLVHKDSTDGYRERVVQRTVAGTDAARDGVRTVRMESQVAWSSWADVAAADLERLVRQEAAEWQLEPLTVSTRRTGGFDSVAQADDIFLTGAEVGVVFFLQRSFLSRYGIRPVLALIGQTITYVDGGWELEFAVAPIATTARQHAITWEEIDDGTAAYEVQWHDVDHPRGLHASVTYEDLGFVSRGLGSTTTGPDTGWDFLP